MLFFVPGATYVIGNFGYSSTRSSRRSLGILDHATRKDSQNYPNDEIMVDSGAQLCVCPKDYPPEIPIRHLDATRKPNVSTVTGEPMTMYGYMIIDYRLASGRWMSIYFIVTDATHPIVSVSAMRKTGYGITVDHKQTLLTYMGHPRAELHDAHGLYFLWPMDLSLIHISEPTRRYAISYAVFCL